MAPISGNPQKIIDLGCGSGAWVIQAALEFPEARVVATDISPLPKREIPQNIQFVLADLTKEWEFELGTFDVIHARLLLTHVPNPEEVISRALQLVKPRGLIIIVDLDYSSTVQTGGPVTRAFASKLTEVWASRNADVEFGRKLAPLIEATGAFSDVEVHKVSTPFSGTDHPDEAVNQLVRQLKATCIHGVQDRRLRELGVTQDMVDAQIEELNQVDCPTVLDTYFCWARRSA
ncbi:S-adenosyl-L-methionine-dependent methyltransferase [Mycena filopes]|nr:S-adenosyl-L-methionine-dependent methyltransferase [Mycena filopes]